MTRSSVASRLGIDNTPNGCEIDDLRDLCENILEPVRVHFGIPFSPSSGYRCAELNEKVGSSPNSQHVEGQAADFEIPGKSNLVVAKWIEDSLTFDQLILEYFDEREPSSGWIHASYDADTIPRMQVLTFNGTLWKSGLPE